MGDNDKRDYEFIKEQIIEKRWRKLRKRLLRLAVTIFTAVLFGIVAAVAFVLTEPYIYKIVNKGDRKKTLITLPTASNGEIPEVTKIPDDTQNADDNETVVKEVISETVIQKIDADLSDYKYMYYELRKVAYKANKSVVNISSTYLVEDWFNNTVEKTIYTTGLIVAETPTEFFVLVSYDRIQNADKIRIKFIDTFYIDARLVDYEKEINIAIIAVNKNDIPSVYLSDMKTAILGENYSLTVGSPIIALGSPNGYINSMEFGIITSEGSSVSVTDNILKLFNTDIYDNPEGDGVIVNLQGEVIGWITRTLKYDLNKNINTAISVSYIKSYIEQMVNQEERIYFGIKAKDMTSDARQAHKVPNGIYVDEVFADSPALKGDIRNGDIIIMVNDNNIINANGFYKFISQYEAGTKLDVKIKRANSSSDKLVDVSVVLSTKPRN